MFIVVNKQFFCMFECTSRTRTLSMFECIMFALWVWEQRNPIARTIENRDANQLPSICHSSTKKWAQTQVSTSQQSKRDTWILFKFLNNLAALAIKGTYFQYTECLQCCIEKLSTKDQIGFTEHNRTLQCFPLGRGIILSNEREKNILKTSEEKENHTSGANHYIITCSMLTICT